MTGPFVRVQETKLYGPTWINAARIVKIQAASHGATIVLEGAGSIQLEEAAETLIGRLEEALAGPPAAGHATRRPSNGARRGKAGPAEAQHG